MFYLQFNLTHHIRHLSFGHEYPGLKHPLDNTYVAAEDGKMFLFVNLDVLVHSSYLFHSFSKTLPWRMRFCATYGLVLNSHDPLSRWNV